MSAIEEFCEWLVTPYEVAIARIMQNPPENGVALSNNMKIIILCRAIDALANGDFRSHQIDYACRCLKRQSPGLKRVYDANHR